MSELSINYNLLLYNPVIFLLNDDSMNTQYITALTGIQIFVEFIPLWYITLKFT
jgi:hypothetical protein